MLLLVLLIVEDRDYQRVEQKQKCNFHGRVIPTRILSERVAAAWVGGAVVQMLALRLLIELSGEVG